MNPFTKLSYLVLIIFPVLLMLIMFIAIVAVGAAGHSSGDTGFFWVLAAIGILYAVMLRNCMRKPYKLRSGILRWATILLTAGSILASMILLIVCFSGYADSFIIPIMFVVAFLTIICGVVVIGDNIKTVRN